MPRRTRFLTPNAAKRVEAVSAIFVPHRNLTTALQAVGRPFETSGKRKLPMCTLVVGPSGVGKSLLSDKLKEAFDGDEDELPFIEDPYPGLTAKHFPVLALEMPDRPQPTTVLQEMLKAFGDEAWNERNPQRLEKRVVRFLQACRTRGVLFDEAQRMVDRTSDVLTMHVLEKVKLIANKARVSIAFLGVDRLSHVMQIDGQIARRWKDTVEFGPYQWPEQKVPLSHPSFQLTADQVELIAVYRAFERMMPIPVADTASVIHQNDEKVFDMCGRLSYANRGAIGLHKKLLEAAMEESDGFDELSLPLLEKAFTVHFSSEPGVINPFGPDWHGQPPPPIRDDAVRLHAVRGSRAFKPKTKRQRLKELADALTK